MHTIGPDGINTSILFPLSLPKEKKEKDRILVCLSRNVRKRYKRGDGKHRISLGRPYAAKLLGKLSRKAFYASQLVHGLNVIKINSK